jgi:hypothetical protein
VTPAPRARKSRSAGGENEIGIKVPAFTRNNVTRQSASVSQCDAQKRCA